MTKAISGAVLLLLTTAGIAVCQNNLSKISYVESWKKGPRKIQEQRVVIEVNRQRPKYEMIVDDISGTTQYRLTIDYHPLKENGPSHNWWSVDLSETFEGYVTHNLLQKEGPGVGDNFPKEDKIAWLYPVEQPNIYSDVMGGYPFSAKRIIKVEEFYVIIQVRDYRFDSKNPRELESLMVEIEFKNNYKRLDETPTAKQTKQRRFR